MAFSDFSEISEVLERYKIKYSEDNFVRVDIINPSEQFQQELEFSRQHFNIFGSEASRCEIVIFPILREVYKGYADNYVMWIKEHITYDETLNGTPDYLIATKSELGIPVLGTPLIMLVEARKNDFELGWGQCLAELVAAQKINKDTTLPVHGIVTDGILWQFGRLVENTFTRNRTNYSLDNLPDLFGAVDSVFKTITDVSVEV